MKKRRLERINTSETNDFYAQIITEEKVFTYKVLDFNSISFRVAPKDNSDHIDLLTPILFFNLIYINKIVGSIKLPEIIRITNHNELIIKTSTLQPKQNREKKRLTISERFRPFLLAQDELNIDRILNFEVIDINSDGIGLRTSLSNKHLIPGNILKNTSLFLPTIGSINADLQITRTDIEQKSIKIGCKFGEISKENLLKIAQFCLFGTAPDINESTVEEKIKQVKENVFRLTEIGQSVSVEIVNCDEDYKNVLNVRFEAYKKASKTDQNTNSPDMFSDIYDPRSIILAAKINGKVAGTVRMVYCKNDHDSLPFEKHLLNYSLKNDRTMYYEVSRLAIDPSLQRSDILVKLFREVARITITNNKTTLCFSTKVLRPMYQKIGFVQISEETPHPVLQDERLALMEVSTNDFIHGTKMTKENWNKFSKKVIENLEFACFLPANSTSSIEKKFAG